MLVELRLRNLAVAAETSLSLDSGLNVLTGSTGAGKSLAVEAVRWLRGEAIDRQVLRKGADSASAEAIFDLAERPALLARLQDLGVDVPEDGVLRLRRELRREGRSRAYVGDGISSASVLRALTDELIEVQSQHQQTALLDPQGHLEVLERAGVDAELRQSYRRDQARWRAAEREIERWRERQAQIREQRDLLEFQHRELDRAQLRGDEIESLRSRVAVMEGGARLMESVHAALLHLNDEERGTLRSLGESRHSLRNVPSELNELVEASENLDGALELVHDAERALERFTSDRDFDPLAMAEAQGRLAEIEDLMRKYARTEAELVELRDRLSSQLEEFGEGDEAPAKLREERDASIDALQNSAKALQRDRKRVARRLEREAPPLLEDLGMSGAALRFDLGVVADPVGPIRLEGRRVQCTPTGPSTVRLEVRTNPGEDFGPVERVASGGELSRLGLVLRSLGLAGRDPALILLDEVDTGLGADLGPAMARRLRALAARSQVLVISHLPAVAASASRHLMASKAAEGDRTASRVDVLDEASRIEELARMLGGKHEQALELAQRLRREATRARAGRAG